MITEEGRGKRTLAKRMLVAQLAVSVAAIWIPQAWVIAQFYAPFIIPAAITLYLGDAVSDTYLKSASARNTSG